MALANYKSIKALVVDDFDSFRMTVSRMLQEFGCRQVDTAVHGGEALRMCSETDYDLILCDYNLGKGRNGLQLLEELRYNRRLSHANLFLLVSAESSRNIVMAASDYGPDGYLTKPITAKTLRQRLDRVLHQRDAMRPVYRAIDEGHDDRAIVLCLSLIDEGSRYGALCQKILGNLYQKTGQYDIAAQVYRQVLEVRELDWAQVGMAQVKRAQGDVDTAIEWLTKIIADQPLCMAAYDELADCYREQKRPDDLQSILEQAVIVSPVALLRQQNLAEVATANNDKEVAAQTYRRVIKLAENSVHNNVENYLAFSRAAAAVFSENESVGREVLRDALTAVGQIEQKFGKDESLALPVQLIEAQLQIHQGNTKRATELYLASNQQMEAAGLLDIDTELDRVMAMMALGQADKAREKLKGLVLSFSNDESALSKIDRLLDEPVSAESRKKVAEINRQGIQLYEQKAYLKAIECFQRARRLFPMHLGVQLNLVQALLGQMNTGDHSDEWSSLTAITMKNVESNINASHAQFQRYRQLQDMVRVTEQQHKSKSVQKG